MPESCANRYLDVLCGASKTVVFTAATPGQPGEDHVNEQPNEYWIERFAHRGYLYERERAQRWRVDWQRKNVPDFYFKNLMIFRHRDGK